MIRELFKFTETRVIAGTPTVLRTETYTSGKNSYTYEGDIYEPAAISTTRPITNLEMSKIKLNISFGIDNVFAKSFFSSYDTTLDLQLYDVDDTVVSKSWAGILSSTDIKKDKRILVFESIFGSLKNRPTRYLFQRTCNNDLFDAQCGLTASSFAEAGTVTSISGTELVVSGLTNSDEDYFTFGTINDASGNSRMIAKSDGSAITISKPCQAFVDSFADFGSFSVTIYPGCAKSRAVCHEKYNNVINSLSFPHMPSGDLFDKKTVI